MRCFGCDGCDVVMACGWFRLLLELGKYLMFEKFHISRKSNIVQTFYVR